MLKLNADTIYYKLLVEDVRDARRARRELSNVFMTLNIAGIGALGFLSTADGLPNRVLFTLCALALVLLLLAWRGWPVPLIVLLGALAGLAL